jgi:hypothetical protein
MELDKLVVLGFKEGLSLEEYQDFKNVVRKIYGNKVEIISLVPDPD